MEIKVNSEKGSATESAIRMAEQYAGENRLTQKDGLHLRLLAEETAEIAGNLSGKREGTLSIGGDRTGSTVRLLIKDVPAEEAGPAPKRPSGGVMSNINLILNLSYEAIEADESKLSGIGVRKAGARDLEEMGLDSSGEAYVWTGEGYNSLSFDRLIQNDDANWIEISHSIIANLTDDLRIFVFRDHSELTAHVPFEKKGKKRTEKYAIDPELTVLYKIPVTKTRFQIKMVQLLYGKLPDRQTSADGIRVEKLKIPCNFAPKGYVSLLRYTPEGAGDGGLSPAVLLMHGGAFMLPAVPYHYRLAKAVVKNTGCSVFFTLQELGPRYSLPLPIREAQEVYRYLIANGKELGIDTKRIAAMGDSSGGTMTAALAMLARDDDTPLAGQLLLYPSIGLDYETKSMKEFTDVPVVNAESIAMFHKIIRTDAGADKYYLHPAKASLENLPPAYVETAEFDALRDEGIAYAGMLKENGCDVVLNKTKGTVHAFDMAKDSRVLAEAMDQRLGFIKRVLNIP